MSKKVLNLSDPFGSKGLPSQIGGSTTHEGDRAKDAASNAFSAQGSAQIAGVANPQATAKEPVASATDSAAQTSTPEHPPVRVHDPNKVVPLHESEMKVWTGNPRHIIDEAALDMLIGTLKEDGQHTPIDVILNPDETDPVRYLIIAGQRRWLATRRAGLNDGILYARVRTDLKTQDELMAAALATQAATEGLTDLDFAISYAHAMKEAGGVRIFARYMNASPGEISKMTQIGNLPEPIMNLMKATPKKFTTLFAYEVVQIHKELGVDEALRFARDIAAKNPSHRVVVQWRDSLLSKEPNEAGGGRGKRRAWDRRNFDKFEGFLKTRESTGEVTLNLRNVDTDRMDRIKKAVDEILQETT